MTPLAKYIWLIEQLQKKDMTFEEINEQWLWEHRNTKDKNISICKRTFHNHIKAIHKEYGIDIVCGPGYKYHIDGPDKEVLPKIGLLTALNTLNETITDKQLNKNLFVGDYFDLFRERRVMAVMDAIKTIHKVKLAKFKNVNNSDKYQVLNVAPYQLHYICSQWYVIGKTDELGLMRIPLLYYKIGGTNVTNVPYKYPAGYSAKEYQNMIYGMTSERIHIAVKIKSYNPQELNLDNYPLSPFQLGIEYRQRKEGESTIDYIASNYVIVRFELPKTPFALFTLKSKLEKYRYEILNKTNPFTLFTEEQYNNEVYYPVVLSTKG